jgi:hypothetical protein
MDRDDIRMLVRRFDSKWRQTRRPIAKLLEDLQAYARLNLDTVGLDFVVKGLAADAQAFGGFEFVAAGFL